MTNATLQWLNALPRPDAINAFRRCCGASAWCDKMADSRPLATPAALRTTADAVFDSLADSDWLQAFACHPRIGDFASLKMKYAGNREWSAGEQAGAQAADDHTLHRLAELNHAYEQEFGYLFIVCASGKSAAEMLTILETRLQHKPEDELPIAAAEQRKITHLRLAKLTPDPPTHC